MTVTVKQLIEALQDCKQNAVVGLECFDGPGVVGAKDVDKLLVSDAAVTLHTKAVSINELHKLAKAMAKQGMLTTLIILK